MSVWANQIEKAIEKIRRLIGKFENKELNFSSIHSNFVCLDGDEKLLKGAVEEDLVCLEDNEELLKEVVEDLYQ